MKEKRPIRQEEKILIEYIIYQLGLNPSDYPIKNQGEPYESSHMGSIGIGDEGAIYSHDLAQLEYIDSDQVYAVISLTVDQNNQLLDFDFWKEDFSALVKYPLPEDLIFKKNL